jgi:hypothetical protein
MTWCKPAKVITWIASALGERGGIAHPHPPTIFAQVFILLRLGCNSFGPL